MSVNHGVYAGALAPPRQRDLRAATSRLWSGRFRPGLAVVPIYATLFLIITFALHRRADLTWLRPGEFRLIIAPGALR
jgi:hypothetical protein